MQALQRNRGFIALEVVTIPHSGSGKKGKWCTVGNDDDYKGIERRDVTAVPAGRRSSDTCAQHCFLVKGWEDTKIQHKEDTKEIEGRLKSAAPLWSVIILCSLVASSVVYTFKASNDIRHVFNERIQASSAEVKTSLNELSTETAIIALKQQQVIRLLEKHIEKFDAFPGYGIGAGNENGKKDWRRVAP